MLPLVSALTLTQTALIVAALSFIFALAGLSRHESAKLGNVAGMVGMTLAGVATVAYAVTHSERNVATTLVLIAVPVLLGSAIGLWLARQVKMTGMPQLIALLHSFVGLAAVLVGFGSFMGSGAEGGTAHLIEVGVGVLIGAYTLTGSLVAFGKLSGRLSSRPLMVAARNVINLVALIAAAVSIGWLALAPHAQGLVPLAVVTVLGLGLGWHMVSSIGGGDMPVVVSMLNSYSGWAAARGRVHARQ